MFVALAAALTLKFQSNGVREIQDVEYLQPGLVYKLDFYLPPTQPAASPAVVWIHGGGWEGGSRRGDHDVQVCRALAENGFAVISVGYHLGKGAWPQNLRDCKIAVRFVRKNAAQYNIDPNRIGVAGASAGGHLATMVGLTNNVQALEPSVMLQGISNSVRCIVDFYGPMDLEYSHLGPYPRMQGSMRKFGEVFANDLNARAFHDASPVNYVRAGLPPMLILHGRADDTVDFGQSTAMAELLRQNGDACETMYMDNVGHAFFWQQFDGRPLPQDPKPVVLAFLRKYLAP